MTKDSLKNGNLREGTNCELEPTRQSTVIAGTEQGNPKFILSVGESRYPRDLALSKKS